MSKTAKKAASRILTAEDILCAELSEGMARLCRFALRVREGRAQNPEDLIALANAFQAIVVGADPKKALGISGKQGQGRNRKSSGEQDRTELYPAFKVEYLRLRERITEDEAKLRVVEMLKLNEHTLKTHHQRHRKAANELATAFVALEDMMGGANELATVVAALEDLMGGRKTT